MTEPRDESLERLLRQTVGRSSAGGAVSPCLDAETMAAWLDGALTGAELAAAEAHAAACEHCRSSAAMVVRIQAEARPGVAVPSIRSASIRDRRLWPWMVPAAAAAILVLAVWYTRRVEPPRQESTVAMAPVTRSEPPAVEALRRVEPHAQPAAEPTSSQLTQGAVESAPPSASPVVPLPPIQPEQLSLLLPPPAPMPVAPEPVPAPKAETAFAATASAPISALDLAAPDVIAEFQSANPAIGRQLAGGAGGAGAPAGRGAPAIAGRGSGRGGAAAPAFRRAPLDPSQPTHWRVLASGFVERSNPPGAPWERVTLEPAGLLVTNGHAPTPLICWLVGRAGTVVLTVDGQSFARLPFPVAIDLISVRASDARVASVTTADGRTFSTTDAGQTWRRD